MSAPTNGQVGLPVTDITDEPATTPAPVIISGQVGEDVKYVPTTGASDDH